MNGLYDKKLEWKHVFYAISGLTLFRLFYLLFIPITPQEAYYWYYIQYPALSYFDHPPMAAYSIGLGTLIFGDTVFGVKFMAVLWFAGINFLFLATAYRLLTMVIPELSKEKIIFFSFAGLIFFNLTIFAHLYSILTVPDTPLLFFWLLSIYLFLRLLQTGQKRWWIFLGISLGLGLLSKYTMIALLPGLFAALLLKKEWRRWLATPYPYLALLIMVLVFSPVIIWNAQHHWASFGFQFSERASKLKPFTTKYVVQLFFSQLFMLTPLVFIALFWFVKKVIRHKLKPEWVGMLFFTGFFIVGGFLYISLKSLVKMNWLLPGYLGWILGVIVLFVQSKRTFTQWMRRGVYFSLFLLLLAYSIQIIPNIPLGEGNTWSGWQDAAHKIHQLQQQMGGKKKVFIFANSYKSASLLKFYLPDHQDTYAQNIYQRPALQFDIWGTPDTLKGKNALYVFDDRHEYKNDLKFVKQYFDSLYLKQKFEYRFLNRWHTRTIYCYEARHYRGTH